MSLRKARAKEQIRAVTTQAAGERPFEGKGGGNSAKRRDAKADNNELRLSGNAKAFVLFPPRMGNLLVARRRGSSSKSELESLLMEAYARCGEKGRGR